MSTRTHVDFFATLTPALIAAVSAAEGRRVSRDEAVARLTRELKAVVERWTAYGAWVERVESGAWLRDYQRTHPARPATPPLVPGSDDGPRGRIWGSRARWHSAEARARMAAMMRAPRRFRRRAGHGGTRAKVNQCL